MKGPREKGEQNFLSSPTLSLLSLPLTSSPIENVATNRLGGAMIRQEAGGGVRRDD